MDRPSKADVRRWRSYLGDERAEAALYTELAKRRTGEERQILLRLADAEGRHAKVWQDRLGDAAHPTPKGHLRTRLLTRLARRFGSLFVLALAQQAETRSPYHHDPDATEQMAADEQVHSEVIRALAEQGRTRLSGSFRAAVFGANDGLVSNLALVLGIGATGVDTAIVLATGVAGLLAGALSMAAGEYISVSSQRELLDASRSDPRTGSAIEHLDVDANELALIYRARGMSEADAEAQAATALRHLRLDQDGSDQGGAGPDDSNRDNHEQIGTPLRAAFSSFWCFALGALVPVLPYACGLAGWPAVIVAAAAVGAILLITGGIVGIMSGKPPLGRALRQLAIGYGAAAVTYLLGLAFGTTIG